MNQLIKVMFHASFREVTGIREIEEKLEKNRTVKFILDKLAKNYGKDFNGIIDPKTNEISTEVLIMLNGRGIRATDIILQDKDVLVITLPLGGG
jgi:MoaD family protein